MRLRNFILVLALFCGTVNTSCISSGHGQGIETLEQMTDAEFSQFQSYTRLGVKIGGTRLLEEKLVTKVELGLAATAIETLRDQTIDPGISHFIDNALAKAGLTNDEIELLLLVVQQELESRGAFKWLNPTTGVIELSPRTKQLLTTVSLALRAVGNEPVTAQDNTEGQKLEARYNGKLLKKS